MPNHASRTCAAMLVQHEPLAVASEPSKEGAPPDMDGPGTPSDPLSSLEISDAFDVDDILRSNEDHDNLMADGYASDPEITTFGHPPPQLAARLYRTRVGARRKSSAASSRRNSLSSAQSHTSSRGHYHGKPGCQSKYVAQHLRRNSIIESRRARLADRAAHAEQVRLRAALVKAAPRGSTSASEERALAAQVAKEKYLAKVAAACAEEVARAKRVAEAVKERKLAAEAKQRLEIEERHAEVEKRRAEYQRNLQERRVRRADSIEKKLAVAEGDDTDYEREPLTQDVAAIRIQRAWRQSCRRVVVGAFVKLNLHTDEEESLSFEAMTTSIADSNVIGITTALLMQLGLQDSHDDNAALNTRTFLSALLLCRHPVAVLNSKMGVHEQEVTRKATDLLNLFRATLDELAPWNDYTPGATQRESLSQAYSSYTSAFAAWKLQDSSVLIEGMVASFVELDAIWQTVKDDSRGEVAADYREGIRDNQVMLLSRIRRVAGPERADMLIKKAIRESRRLRPRRRPAAEVRPRGVESSAAVAAAATAANASLDDSDLAVEAALPRLEELHSGEITRKLFTPMPSNRVLTHELAIDKDYRMTDASAALREDVYRAVCDAMKQGFEAGDGSAWTISAAENVREKLLRMLKPGNSMHALISEALDLDQVARQCQANVFSYDRFFGFMCSILPKLCAPFRDAAIAKVVQELQADDNSLDGMISKLFKLLRAVDMLSLDYTNFMLMNAAPTLIREAPGYEARQFAGDLQDGRISLLRTRQWYRSSYDGLRHEIDRRDPEGLFRNRPGDQPQREQAYARGLVDLAIGPGHLSDEDIPETLALDTTRLRDMRARTVRVAVIGAILLTAKNLLKRDVRGQWRNESTRLWQLFSSSTFSNEAGESSTGDTAELSTTQKAFAIVEMAHNMPPTTKTQLLSAVARFCGQAATAEASLGGRFTDPVLKVLLNRLRTHILNRISAVTASEKVRAASSAAESLTAYGLGEMTMQVGQMVDTLERIRVVDLQAHGRWYEEVMSETSEDAADPNETSELR